MNSLLKRKNNIYIKNIDKLKIRQDFSIFCQRCTIALSYTEGFIMQKNEDVDDSLYLISGFIYKKKFNYLSTYLRKYSVSILTSIDDQLY